VRSLDDVLSHYLHLLAREEARRALCARSTLAAAVLKALEEEAGAAPLALLEPLVSHPALQAAAREREAPEAASPAREPARRAPPLRSPHAARKPSAPRKRAAPAPRSEAAARGAPATRSRGRATLQAPPLAADEGGPLFGLEIIPHEIEELLGNEEQVHALGRYIANGVGAAWEGLGVADLRMDSVLHALGADPAARQLLGPLVRPAAGGEGDGAAEEGASRHAPPPPQPEPVPVLAAGTEAAAMEFEVEAAGRAGGGGEEEEEAEPMPDDVDEDAFLRKYHAAKKAGQ